MLCIVLFCIFLLQNVFFSLTVFIVMQYTKANSFCVKTYFAVNQNLIMVRQEELLITFSPCQRCSILNGPLPASFTLVPLWALYTQPPLSPSPSPSIHTTLKTTSNILSSHYSAVFINNKHICIWKHCAFLWMVHEGTTLECFFSHSTSITADWSVALCFQLWSCRYLPVSFL